MVTLKDPRVSDANDMGNWHNMVPRIKLGMFTFMIGQVPVDIHMYVGNRIQNGTVYYYYDKHATRSPFLPSCLL